MPLDPELAYRLQQIFGGTTPFIFVWKDTGWPGIKKLTYKEEEYYQITDPITGRVFQGIGLARIMAAVCDSRSYDCLEMNVSQSAPVGISLAHVAVDKNNNITGVYTTENDCPTLKPGWHTPDEVIQDATVRGDSRYGTNRLDMLAKHVADAISLKVRYDPVTDSFNKPVEPLPPLPF